MTYDSEIRELRDMFVNRRDLEFRFYPDACTSMRYQAGRYVTEVGILPDGKEEAVEYFQLLAWGASRSELIAALDNRLPAPAPNSEIISEASVAIHDRAISTACHRNVTEAEAVRIVQDRSGPPAALLSRRDGQ